jgi:MFS transporter, Spinster family, sphingosine-1-phosphate transporter
VGSVIGTRFGWRWAFYVAGLPGAALAVVLMSLRDPPRGLLDADSAPASPTTSPTAGRAAVPWHAVFARRSYTFNLIAQTIYTFAMGGLGAWMPTYFSRERNLDLASAGVVFGGILCLAGFVGTLLGGQLGDAMARRYRTAHFLLSGAGLLASIPFTLLAVLGRSPAIFWPAMFVTLTLLFLNMGPLNAAMANVLPPELRGRGFGINVLAIHMLGDAFSPLVIGFASDRMGGLRMPILATGLLLGIAGLVLLLGRPALARDLEGVR